MMKGKLTNKVSPERAHDDLMKGILAYYWHDKLVVTIRRIEEKANLCMIFMEKKNVRGWVKVDLL